MGGKTYDAVVIGAGSVGLPAAMFMAEKGFKKILCLDQHASPGQGCNKAAIGGIRATHSSPAKISLCLDSLRIFSTWKDEHGVDLEWQQGGYSFVAYGEEQARHLKELLIIQKAAGLTIEWHAAADLLKIVPSLNPEGLIGGTFSLKDGSASPMLSSCAFYERATALGVECHFKEHVEAVIVRQGRVSGVRTDRADYAAGIVVNAAGGQAAEVAKSAGQDIPVAPDCHEAGITEPVQRFLGPMVVDIRAIPGIKNCYFHQHATGQVIFCFTPDPPVAGSDRRETSGFLPIAARRMVEIMPRLAAIRVRRTWRGIYPMTPDGSPVIGASRKIKGYLTAAGMCGQGYMLGPGVGALLARVAAQDLRNGDEEILHELSPERSYGSAEELK
jgi:sarcosine oxidase, subunit beta